MMRSHIIHINFSITLGGIDTMLMDIINEQVKFIKVTLIVVNEHIEDLVIKDLNKNVKLIRIGRKVGSRNLFKIAQLNYYLLKLKPTGIHCHNSKLINLIFVKNCPKVLTVHDVNYPTNNYHKYDRIFAISQAVKLDIENNSEIKAITVYNGLNEELIRVRKELTKNKFYTIVLIGRLEHEKKGQDILIKAIHRIKQENRNFGFHVDILGEGSSKEYLMKMVEKYNLSDNIAFLGGKSRSFVYENLSNYDLLVQPSRYEGFGLTVAEAMFAKIPVLVSDKDGPMEIIGQGEFGKSFKNGDVEDLANVLIELLEKYDYIYNKYVSIAFKNVNTNFNIVNTAQNYIANYLKL